MPLINRDALLSDENRLPGLFYQRLRSIASEPLAHAAVAGLLSWIVYLATLTPSIAWGDSPELVSDAYELGVPHPTGYPLFMLLGHLAIRLLPWGDPAYRMNLMSACFGGLAVAVAHRLTGRLTGSLFAAWITALALALAPLFWSEAVIAEVYALSALLVFCLLDQIAAWDETGDPRHLRLA